MTEQQSTPLWGSVVEITELAVLGEQFSLRLMQLGFRLMQVVNGDGRDVHRFMLPPICEVPAGPFLMGTDPEHTSSWHEDETPQCEIVVPAFYLSTYPLTVAEYAYAVEVGAVKEPQTDEHHTTWGDQLAHPDYPVVCIIWHQARSYAAWVK